MHDRFGLLPANIRANYEREQMVDRQIERASQLLAALRAQDPRLDVVFFSDRADPINGIIPGRWHVVRRNDPPTPESYFPITTESGNYREPDMGVYYELMSRDMWASSEAGAKRKLEERITKAKPSAKREGPTDEQARDEIAADVKAGWRVAGDGGLTARKWGKGGSGRSKD